MQISKLSLALTVPSCVIKKLTTSVFHSALTLFPGRGEQSRAARADRDRAKVNDLRIHEDQKGKCSV